MNTSACFPSRRHKTESGKCVCGSTKCWPHEELIEPETFQSISLSVSPVCCKSVFHSEVCLSDRHTSLPTPPVSLSCFLPLLVGGAREELHYVSLPILCLPPLFLPALQYHHRMAPPIESAAASTICLQWRGRGGEGREERREGGMLEGEGQKEREIGEGGG